MKRQRHATTNNQFDVPHAMMMGLFPAGLLMILMIVRLAQRGFFDGAIIDGDTLNAGSGAEIGQRVLTKTIEQTVLAICI